MKNFKVILVILFAGTCLVANSQSIQITILPASDYTLARRDEWKVIANNTTNQTLKVYFYGLVTEAQRGKIYEVVSKSRDIAPGSTTFSTNYYVDLEPFNTLYEDPTIRQYGIQTNGLPAGDYEICITALSAIDSSELGYNCYSFSADYFSPAVLVTPDNNDTVCEPYPFFSWLPPVPNNGQNFTYTLSLYELQNMQTIFSAVQTNPAFYERKGIASPIFQYGINARNLREGQRYAWKVSAEVNNQTVATSEIWSFVYCKKGSFVFGSDTTKKKKEVLKNQAKAGIPYLETVIDLKNNFSMLDRGLLSFVYTHQSKTPTVGMRILDMKGGTVYSKMLEVGYGANYFSAPLSSYNSLQANTLYELQIIDMNGAIKKLRFKVKP